MSLPLIFIGIIIMAFAAVIHEAVRRRHKPMWTLVFIGGLAVTITGMFTHDPIPPQAEAGGTSQHSKADRLDLPVFTMRKERRT